MKLVSAFSSVTRTFGLRRQINPINTVRAVESAMDLLYHALETRYGSNTDRMVVRETRRLRDGYYNKLSEGWQADFADPLVRFAYLYGYTAVRASITYEIIAKYEALEGLFNRRILHVGCIAGGPGSELLGIAKFIAAKRKRAEVKAEVYDRYVGWEQCWRPVRTVLPRRVRLMAEYKHHDILSPATWQSSTQPSNITLYTLSYCLSEFRSRQDRAEAYFQRLFAAPPGTHFLFVETSYSTDVEWLDQMIRSHNIELLPDRCGITQGKFSPKFKLSDVEQNALNECYHGKLSGCLPFTDLKPVYRVGRKT